MESTRASRYNPWIDNGKNQTTESKQNTVIVYKQTLFESKPRCFECFECLECFECFERFATAPGQKEGANPEVEREPHVDVFYLCLFASLPLSFSFSISFTSPIFAASSLNYPFAFQLSTPSLSNPIRCCLQIL